MHRARRRGEVPRSRPANLAPRREDKSRNSARKANARGFARIGRVAVRSNVYHHYQSLLHAALIAVTKLVLARVYSLCKEWRNRYFFRRGAERRINGGRCGTIM